jgi:alkylation response protein AidB-like acyl-CoA dehydrogenase
MMTLLADDLAAPAAATRPRLVEVARGLEPVIRAAEPSMEIDRVFPAELTTAFYDGGIYKAFLPRELGGLEVEPLEWLEAVEEVSRINGSAGWLCMLHTGATFAPVETMRHILETERWIIAGNIGRAGGTARKVDGGYIFSGRWPFSSGSPEATYLFGRAILVDDNGDQVLSTMDGLPLFLVGYFPAADVTLHDTWDGLGLRGTGSGDIEVTDLFVPSEMVNESGIWKLEYNRPLFRAPFNLSAHAAHSLGLAKAAIEEYTAAAVSGAKRGLYNPQRFGATQVQQIAIAKATAMVRAARLLLWDTIEAAWDDAQDHFRIDYELRVRMHEANVFVVNSCYEAVKMLFAEMGTAGVFKGRPMERIFRDITVAAQHLIVGEHSYDRIGQYLLTRELPDGPIIEDGFIAGPHPRVIRQLAEARAAGAAKS